MDDDEGELTTAARATTVRVITSITRGTRPPRPGPGCLFHEFCKLVSKHIDNGK